jgi:hypothetical protein
MDDKKEPTKLIIQVKVEDRPQLPNRNTLLARIRNGSSPKEHSMA